jgi:hypothetical protein
MFPIFCSVCIADGYNLPPNAASPTEWDRHSWRGMLAVTVWRGDAYCARHWNERAGRGELTIESETQGSGGS